MTYEQWRISYQDSEQAARAAFSAWKDAEQERDQFKSQVTLQQAANAACLHLPEGWRISLNLEKDAGYFELINPDGDEINPVAFQGESLAEELNEMLNIANGFTEGKSKSEVPE